MFLEIANFGELLRIISEQAPAALQWAIGILGTLGAGTIVGAIITIVKGLIQNKALTHSVEKSAKDSREVIEAVKRELTEEIKASNKDNALVAEILMMIASKNGFTPEEIVSITKRYNSFANADKSVSEEIIENVNKTSQEAEKEAQKEAEEVEAVNTEIKSLKSTEKVEEQVTEQVEIKL